MYFTKFFQYKIYDKCKLSKILHKFHDKIYNIFFFHSDKCKYYFALHLTRVILNIYFLNRNTNLIRYVNSLVKIEVSL